MDTFKISVHRLKEKAIIGFLILLASLPGILPLLKPGFFPTQDGDNLIIRFADFHRAILDFHFPPRWAGYLNHTFGYPVLIFLYPGLLFIWEAIHFLGFNLLMSVKISLILSVILSGFFMYFFVKEIFGKLPALVSAIFYIYFPYRFVNIYLRGSFGEALSFALVPLIFWAILNLVKHRQKKYLILSSTFSALLITVHNVQALIFFPIILLFLTTLLLGEKPRGENTTLGLIFTGLTLGLSGFFWLPAFLERRFTVFDKVPVSPFFNHFLDIKHLFFFHKPTEELPLQIGFLHFLIGFVVLPLLFFIRGRRKKVISALFIVVFLISFFLMIEVSYRLWQTARIDKFLQFPWRFLGLNAFVTSFLAALPASWIKKELKLVLTGILIIGVILSSLPYTRPIGFLHRDDDFYLTNDATTTSSNEYLPIWVKKAPTKAPPEKIEAEEAEIEIQEYKTHKRKFMVKSPKETRVQINTFYFPGWQIFVDGKKVEIDYQNNNGLLVFKILPGEHQVVARFTETTVRKLANLITLISLFSIIYLFKKRNEKIFN